MPEFKLSNSPYGSETPQLPEKLYSELQQYVDQSGCSKFVMSSECFYEWTEPKVFAAGLGPIFDQIWIVVYLRPQTDWILSVHNQLVKDNFFKYSQGLCDLPQQTLLYYYDILQSWEDSFGESCILVRPYHTDKSFNVVTDFLELIGVKEKEGDDCYFHNIFENQSLPHEYVELLKEINKSSVSQDCREILIEIFSKQDSKNIFCSNSFDDIVSTAQAIVKSKKLRNDKLFNKYFKGRNPWQ